jgi:hypothetical protein
MSNSGRLRIGLVVVVMIVALALIAACGRSREGTLQGTVTQARDAQQALDDPANVGRPLAQAQVVVYGLNRVEEFSQPEVYRKGLIVYKGRSGDDGTFSVTLAPGKYIAQIWVNGLEVGSRQVEVTGGQTTEADFNVKLP